jgi:hypothetical protein
MTCSVGQDWVFRPVSYPLPAPEGADGSSSQPEGRKPVPLSGVRRPRLEAAVRSAHCRSCELPSSRSRKDTTAVRAAAAASAFRSEDLHIRNFASRAQARARRLGCRRRTHFRSFLAARPEGLIASPSRKQALAVALGPEGPKACGLHSAAPLWRLARPEGLARCRWGTSASFGPKLSPKTSPRSKESAVSGLPKEKSEDIAFIRSDDAGLNPREQRSEDLSYLGSSAVDLVRFRLDPKISPFGSIRRPRRLPGWPIASASFRKVPKVLPSSH